MIYTPNNVDKIVFFRSHENSINIEKIRTALKSNPQTGFHTPTTDIDFPFQIMVAKTEHIPMMISRFVSRIQITSIFKTIHLEYLADKTIRTTEDIKNLVKSI